jgi:simple sugar transport system permease protein
MSIDLGYFQQSIVLATPLILAALGGVLSERAGVFAIGLEGYMLVGTFTAVWSAQVFHLLWAAVLMVILVGMAYAGLLGIATITYGADQILAGVAINILAIGLTTYFARVAWGLGAAPVIDIGGRWHVPILSEIPVLGQVLFQQAVLTYVSFVLTVAIAVVLWRTRWGLVVRATGEMAAAVDASGFSVERIRYLSVMVSGALAALGGAVLSLSQAQTFTSNMTGGRGFVALTAAIFGRWNPLPVAAGALLFGAVDALQLRLQISIAGGSSYLIQSVPAFIAIVAIAVAGRGARHPANIGIPYRREEL